MPLAGGKHASAAGLSLLLSLVASGLASPLDNRQEGCNHDNLLRALLNPTRSAEATDFCNSQLCRFGEPVTATTHAIAHPLYLYNLHPLGANPTRVTYGSPSTPTAIPGNPACWGWPRGVACPYPDPGHGPVVRRDEPARETPTPSPTGLPASAAAASDCAAPALPTFLATTYPPARLSSACACVLGSAATAGPLITPTSECTVLATAAAPRTTVPQFCDPAWHVNAPARTGNPRSGHTATADVGPVADKVDCCVRCAGVFDCVAWSYRPQATGGGGTPPAADEGRLDDPWRPGTCFVVYNTGEAPRENAAANCPNGAVGNILDGSRNGPPLVPGGTPFRWGHLYRNGWNQGPCGMPTNHLQSGQSPGFDYDSLCPAGQ